jgi:hypothetical protein
VQVCNLHHVSDVKQIVEQTRPKVAPCGLGSVQVHPLLVVATCRLLNKLNPSLDAGGIFNSLSDDGSIELSSGGKIFSILDFRSFLLLKGINIFPIRCFHGLALTSGDNLSDPSDEWRWI